MSGIDCDAAAEAAGYEYAMECKDEEIHRLRAEADALRKDAERWRYARNLVLASEIENGAYSLKAIGGRVDEEWSIAADKAIDAAMGAKA